MCDAPKYWRRRKQGSFFLGACQDSAEKIPLRFQSSKPSGYDRLGLRRRGEGAWFGELRATRDQPVLAVRPGASSNLVSYSFVFAEDLARRESLSARIRVGRYRSLGLGRFPLITATPKQMEPFAVMLSPMSSKVAPSEAVLGAPSSTTSRPSCFEDVDTY